MTVMIQSAGELAEERKDGNSDRLAMDLARIVTCPSRHELNETIRCWVFYSAMLGHPVLRDNVPESSYG